MTFPGFLKKEKDKVLFNDSNKELIYYIPESYFDSKAAVIIGEYVTLMGIFSYTLSDIKTNKNNGLHNFNFQSVFICKPTEIEKVKKIKLTKYSSIEDYRLLKFRKDSEPISSTKVPIGVANAETFFKMFIYSRLPNTIPNDELPDYFINNIHINGADYNISIQMIGALIRETSRCINDPSKLFAYTDMKDMHNYQLIPLLSLPKLVSPFNAITSENWDQAVVGAIQNKNEVNSPMEKLLML